MDFYDRYHLPLPTFAGRQSINLVSRDFADVIRGYRANDAIDEVAVSTMLVSATSGEEHFSVLVASTALSEVGLFDILEITPTKEALDRSGAPDVFAEAMRRGAACTHDIIAVDHLALEEDPLSGVRETLGVTPRRV